MKLVINRCYGGFGLSNKAMRAILKRKGITSFERESSFGSVDFYKIPPEKYDKLSEEAKIKRSEGATNAYAEVNDTYISAYDWPRNDPDLVAVVEELGDDASDRFAQLAVVEIPDDVDYYIDEYDGIETVHENHRSWT